MGALLSSLFDSKPLEEIIRNFLDCEALKIAAQEQLGLDTSRYNFAIVGHTKTGKSSLINAIVGSNVANTGVTETTHSITKYEITHNSSICLWDIPGSGTQCHKAENYFKDKKLYAFD